LRYEPNRNPQFTYARLRELVRNRQAGLIQQEMSPDVSPTADLTPFHLPAGRLRIELPENTTAERADLNMQQAEVRWNLRLGTKPITFRVFACATQNVIVVTLEGIARWKPRVSLQALSEIQPDLIGKLGYEKPIQGKDADYSWTVQRIPEGGEVAAVWRTDTSPGQWHLLLTIPSQDDPEPIAAGRRTLEAAHRLGVAQLCAQHRAWWRERWARSSVHLPEKELERLWTNGIYKLASSSRSSVPTNLQGLWPPDGQLPPWRGDYHCDMNVQEAYWPAYNSNQLDLAEPLNRWLVETVAPEAEAFTKRFFGVEGLWMGTAYDVRGRLLGGKTNWYTVQYWLGAGGWLAQHLWWSYRYSLDDQFLRRTAYPFLKKCMQFYENILEQGPDGKLHIPLSASPEYFSNDLEAWTPDPTCDLSIIRNLAQYCVNAAEVLGIDEADRARWRTLLSNLAPYPTSSATGFKVQPQAEYNRSHRHPMHLFAIFPGEDLTIEGSEQDRKIIAASLLNWIRQGMGEWAGHSYPNSIPIAARLRRPNHAWNLLHMYAEAFTLPNGFKADGDYQQFGVSIYSTATDLYTFEAECAFTAAVNEMLVQSWGGKLRILPAVPAIWSNVSFENLRAEGALLVSGQRTDGRFIRFSILSEKGGEVRLIWPPGPYPAEFRFEEKVLKFAPGEQKDFVFDEAKLA
jgi:alpha-L-fucosidase 2